MVSILGTCFITTDLYMVNTTWKNKIRIGTEACSLSRSSPNLFTTCVMRLSDSFYWLI